MAETIKARLHRVIGGYLCLSRGRHNLVLAEHHWHERTGVSRSSKIEGLPGRSITLHEVEHHFTNRPVCVTCWQMPGD